MILPLCRGDREDKELLACSILGIITRREVYNKIVIKNATDEKTRPTAYIQHPIQYCYLIQ